jgi:hypothetical protein
MILSSVLPAIGLFIVSNAGRRPGSSPASTWDSPGFWARPCS